MDNINAFLLINQNSCGFLFLLIVYAMLSYSDKLCFLTCNCALIRSYYLTSHEMKMSRVMDPNSFTHCIRIYNHHHLIYYSIKIQNQIHNYIRFIRKLTRYFTIV